MDGPRSRADRKADALRMLAASDADVWVASSSPEGTAHLVPLSYAWIDERIVLACEATSLTARNIIATGRVRLGLGPTRDVVMIDGRLDHHTPVSEAGNAVLDRYQAQAGWDARTVPTNHLLAIAPTRIQAWREANEITGRTLMRNSTWLT